MRSQRESLNKFLYKEPVLPFFEKINGPGSDARILDQGEKTILFLEQFQGVMPMGHGVYTRTGFLDNYSIAGFFVECRVDASRIGEAEHILHFTSVLLQAMTVFRRFPRFSRRDYRAYPRRRYGVRPSFVLKVTPIGRDQYRRALSLYIQDLIKAHSAVAVEDYPAFLVAMVGKNIRTIQFSGALVYLFNKFEKLIIIPWVDGDEFSRTPTRPVLAVQQKKD